MATNNSQSEKSGWRYEKVKTLTDIVELQIWRVTAPECTTHYEIRIPSAHVDWEGGFGPDCLLEGAMFLLSAYGCVLELSQIDRMRAMEGAQ